MGRMKNYTTKSMAKQLYIGYYIGDKIEIVGINKVEEDGRVISELIYEVTNENINLLRDIINYNVEKLNNEQRDEGRRKRSQQLSIYFEKKEQKEKEEGERKKEEEERAKEKERYKEDEFNAMLKAFMENDKELLKEFDKKNRKKGRK